MYFYFRTEIFLYFSFIKKATLSSIPISLICEYQQVWEPLTFNFFCSCLEQEHDKQVQELEAIIRERSKENKRQKESFDTLKQANDGLRSQVD